MARPDLPCYLRRMLCRHVLIAMLVTSTASADTVAPEVFVDAAALERYRCITHWEQVCETDISAAHQIELGADHATYRSWPDLDEKLVLARSPDSSMTSRLHGYALALQRRGHELLYFGPNLCCTGDPVGMVLANPPVKSTVFRFVRLAELTETRKRAMQIVPGAKCPAHKIAPRDTARGARCVFRAFPPVE